MAVLLKPNRIGIAETRSDGRPLDEMYIECGAVSRGKITKSRGAIWQRHGNECRQLIIASECGQEPWFAAYTIVCVIPTMAGAR